MVGAARAAGKGEQSPWVVGTRGTPPARYPGAEAAPGPGRHRRPPHPPHRPELPAGPGSAAGPTCTAPGPAHPATRMAAALPPALSHPRPPYRFRGGQGRGGQRAPPGRQCASGACAVPTLKPQGSVFPGRDSGTCPESGMGSAAPRAQPVPAAPHAPLSFPAAAEANPGLLGYAVKRRRNSCPGGPRQGAGRSLLFI